jgi:hypothetical protein
MPPGLTVAIALLAQAAGAAPAGAAPSSTTVVTPTQRACDPNRPSGNPDEIVICAPQPQGYRLDPDLMEAKRLKKEGGRPTRPGPIAIKDTSRCVVGPAGCATAGINLLGAAMTAGEMAARVAKGQEIGSMFETDPQPTDYQLYLWAKQVRDAKEAEANAKAAQAAAVAKLKAKAAAEAAKPAGQP